MTSIWKGLPFFAWMFSYVIQCFEDGTFSFTHEVFFLLFGSVLDSFSLVPFPLFVALIHSVYKFCTESCKKKVGNEEHLDWKKISQNFNLLGIGGTLYVLILLFPIPSNKKLGRDIQGNLGPYSNENIDYCNYIKDNTQKDFAQEFNKPPSQTGQASMWNSVYEALLQTACETQATWGMGNIKYFMVALFLPLSLFNSTTSYFMIAIYAIMIFLWFVSQDDEKMWMWTMPKDDITFMHIMAFLLSFFSAVCYNNKHFGKGVLHNWLLYVIAVYQLVSPTLWECDWFVLILFVVFPILQICSRKIFDWLEKVQVDNIYCCKFFLLKACYTIPYFLAFAVYRYNFKSISAEEEKKLKETWTYYFRHEIVALDPWVEFLDTVTSKVFGFKCNIVLPKIAHDVYEPVAGLWGTLLNGFGDIVTVGVTFLKNFNWVATIAATVGTLSIASTIWIVLIIVICLFCVSAAICWYNRDGIGSRCGKSVDACGNFMKEFFDKIIEFFKMFNQGYKQAHDVNRILVEESIKLSDEEWRYLRQMKRTDQQKYFREFLEARLKRAEEMNDANASSLKSAIEAFDIGKGACMDTLYALMGPKQVRAEASVSSRTGAVQGRGRSPGPGQASQGRGRAASRGRRANQGGGLSRGGRGRSANQGVPPAGGRPAPPTITRFRIETKEVVKTVNNIVSPCSIIIGSGASLKLVLNHKDYKGAAGHEIILRAEVYNKATNQLAGNSFDPQQNTFKHNQNITWRCKSGDDWNVLYNPVTSIIYFTMPHDQKNFNAIVSEVGQFTC